MNIRKAKTEDAQQLESLYLLTRLKTFTLRPVNEFRIGDYQKSVADDEVWVAEESGVIVGFVSIYLADNFIHNLFVHPSYQGKGIGKQLLRVAESLLERPMTLKIALDNLKVCGFYEKYGWHKVSLHADIAEPYLLYANTHHEERSI